jgi:hypothetical protein
MKFRESLVSHNLARFLVPATRFTSAKGPTRGTGLALFRDARVNRSAPNERGFGAFVSRSDREGGTRARRYRERSRRVDRSPASGSTTTLGVRPLVSDDPLASARRIERGRRI